SEFTKQQFYDGNQFSGRIDYQGDTNKVFGRYFFDRYSDPYYSPATNGGASSAFVALRGFTSPTHFDYPSLSIGWSHNFGPNVLNEARAGWTRGVGYVASNNSGVPQITVDPGQIDPVTGQSLGSAHLSSNIRGWRNISFGAFVNDDWKVSPRLTLTLGLRYDLYTRHVDKYGHVTHFVLPSGSNLTERLRAANCFVDVSGGVGFDMQPCNSGFVAANGQTLATGDHKNFGPRIGFAYDVFGDCKTTLRGGVGVSYQGEVYNPLSNSRWNPPFYSFDGAGCSDGTNKIGAQFPDSCVFGPVDGSAPTYTGPPTNKGAGPAGSTSNAFAGNIQGWNPY